MKRSAKHYAQVLFASVNKHPRQSREIVQAFIKEMQDQRASHLMPQVLHYVNDLQNEKDGISEVQLFSAKPLHESVKKSLMQMIEKKQWVTNTVQFKECIEPGLLGGMKIKIKDKLIDFSYKNALNQFAYQIAARD